MTAYILRRLLYAIPILFGVNLATFLLFFFINTPDDMARRHVSAKRHSPEQIEAWKRQRNYHLPKFYNNGWTDEDLKEFKRSGWKTLTGLKPGRCALRLELPKGAGAVRVSLAAFPEGALRLKPPWGPPTEGLKAPEEDLFPQGTAEALLDPEKGRTERLPFEIDPERAPKGARLAVHVEIPKDQGRVIVRLSRLRNLSWIERFTQTIFFQKSLRMMAFRFGTSDRGEPIGREIAKRIVPSLTITVPMFLIGLAAQIATSMMLAYFRGTYLDFWGVVLCVILMSISIMFYVIGGQWLLSRQLRLFPVSGYTEGLDGLKFVLLPVLIGVLGGLGSGARWYRTIFLEEIGKDYVRTARSKGLPEGVVLYKHTLKNAMIPILTGVVVTLPFLFIGSLVLESFFAIPGMGSYTIDAIRAQDFAVVQSMVYLGSVLYVIGLILTDISYTLVDPRVRLQ